MSLSELCGHFKILSDLEALSKEEKGFLLKFLLGEYRRREHKRIHYLMRMSGVKRVKLLADFDWTFNPKNTQGQAHIVYKHRLA